MTIKKFAAALGFCLAFLFNTQAFAQDTDRLAMARELMTLMRVEETVSGLFETMAPMAAAGMSQQLGLGAVDQARLGELLGEEFRAAAPDMINQMVQAYANALSEQELREIVTFMRTPSGRALVQAQFTAQSELERIGQVAGMNAGVRALTRLQAERAQRPQQQP